jgi:hypothetical protein
MDRRRFRTEIRGRDGQAGEERGFSVEQAARDLDVHETPQAQGSAVLTQSYNIQLASRANPTFFGVRFVK